MFFEAKEGALQFRKGCEIVRIESWGKDSLRVRSTVYPAFTGRDWALEKPETATALVETDGNSYGKITNGDIRCEVDHSGLISFYKKDVQVLKEFSRDYSNPECRESRCLKVYARDYRAIIGGDYRLSVRFESDRKEKIFGMGQYQQPDFDLKGCELQLAQRNSQVSVPFAVSSLGYGFLWNNPGVGRATFGKNNTLWEAYATKEMDYWITVGDTPAQILLNYTAVTGRAPEIPDNLLGLWQCKLRYRTQDEVLSVVRKYKELGIHIDVIVIDFFHWTRQGDWHFDPQYWPDPKAMCDEIHENGTKVVVSVWPSVDKKSENFYELQDRGLLIRTEHGTNSTYDFQGDCLELDATNPEAQRFVWEKCKANYADFGIDMFWLDNSEPDYNVYDYDNYRYWLGTALEVTNIYPQCYTKAFDDGLAAMGQEKRLHLVRSAWAGSQKYNTLVWSGDVPSTFESLRDQMVAGMHMGLAGIPWWTTDIGGFMTDDVADPAFVELLLRWYEYAVFTPFLRMHGDRGPHNIPPLDDSEAYGGGHLYTGQPNELWSYGEDAFKVMKDQLAVRESLIPYIDGLFKEASTNGSPLIRTMFYEFPEDAKCWEAEDQFMFGDKYLVAPILELGARSREVYLPAGTWEDFYTKEIVEGGKVITCDAPIEKIPVFVRK